MISVAEAESFRVERASDECELLMIWAAFR
jgi:hypothetical protein